jgi:phospholipid/cholesterol/gamma-HCH transport system substrate-binding protein
VAERAVAAGGDEDRSPLARAAAGAALLAVIALVAILLFGGGGAYNVSATFENASQLVAGNQVRLGGVPVGAVTDLELADDGRATVEMEIDDDHSPLDDGTRAVIRQTSLSGIANRFVDLQLPQGANGGEIDDGGEIPADDTQSAVELDALFNTLDGRTRAALQRFFKGSAAMFAGRGDQARKGFRYLNPALGTSRRAFTELAGDTALLERFVVDSAKLVTAAAARRDDLAALISNLNATTRAAGADKAALAEALERLPGFMRRANTTFVNLRGALDDLDPLVDASKPAATRLRAFLPELRGFAGDARPTIRDLSRTIRDPGGDDDLIELLRTFPPLARIAIDSAERNGRERPGSFPITAEALRDATPLIAFGRPYTPDLFGWFDDFSHTGSYDALGGFSRTQAYFNLLSADVPGQPGQLLTPQQQASEFLEVARTGQLRRCPGHSEVAAADGSNVYSDEELQALDCDPTHRAAGP